MDAFKITQQFHEYCKECPDVELETIGPGVFYADGHRFAGSDCTVTCSHYGLCGRIQRLIETRGGHPRSE